MRRFFFLFITISLFIAQLNAQYNDREFGVLAFININSNSPATITINNVNVVQLPPKNILYHKTYSVGKALLSVSGVSPVSITNVTLANNDTIYIEVELRGNVVWLVKEKTKDYVLEEYKRYRKVYSTERITYPYIPESFENNERKGKRFGSGFLLSEEGYIATNYHVIENTKKVVARGVNGNKNSSLSLKVIYTDTINDLAILRLEDKITIEKPVYSFKSTATDVGEGIFVLGYPLTEAMGEDIKLTDGLVSSKNGFKGDTASYQISAPVQPGNSGAPLFDKNGNIVGIVNAKLSGAENATYAIKVNFLQQAIGEAGITLSANTANTLAGKELPEQVKAIQNFVYIIEAE